jgi:hypothetical protein
LEMNIPDMVCSVYSNIGGLDHIVFSTLHDA